MNGSDVLPGIVVTVQMYSLNETICDNHGDPQVIGVLFACVGWIARLSGIPEITRHRYRRIISGALGEIFSVWPRIEQIVRDSILTVDYGVELSLTRPT